MNDPEIKGPDIPKIVAVLYKLLGEQEGVDIEYTVELKTKDETA